MKLKYFNPGTSLLDRICPILIVLLIASCRTSSPGAAGNPRELQVIHKIEGQILSRPIPIYSKAILVSTRLDKAVKETDGFVVVLVVGEKDMRDLLSFYDGVFWDRQSSGGFRNPENKKHLHVPPEPDYAALYQLDDGLLVGLNAVKLELGQVHSKIEKPVQVTISLFHIK
jgi:hypothetical protein